MTQINITLGTAGHIDHGKTALIRLLTGCETDRLKEEKERGMSIELGFAPCVLGDMEVGIVDVPGHEHFIKTMVAGAAGIDGVLFVVAADDGIMPQTREHLDILTLLGVRYGMVVLTKVDRVPAERVAAVTEEMKAFLHGTFLEDSPICPMSSITGEGFDGFYTALKELIAAIRPRSIDGVFRQPVERAFSVKGFGTIVSGIPAAGSATVGQEVTLLPSGQTGRIKAIQVYGKAAERVQSGQCAAINVPQLDFHEVGRGDVLTVEGYFAPRQWFLCAMTTCGGQSLPKKNGVQMKFHTGTAEAVGAVYRLDEAAGADNVETLIQIRTETPLVAGPGDRFILRALSPVRTVGGGRILEAMAQRLRGPGGQTVEYARRLAGVQNEDAAFAAFAVVSARSGAARTNDVSVFIKQTPENTRRLLTQLAEEGQIVRLAEDLNIHAERLSALEAVLTAEIEGFHKARPELPGMEAGALMERLGVVKGVFDALLAYWLGRGTVVMRLERLALPSHSETCDPALAARLCKVESAFRDNMFSPPSVDELPRETKLSVAQCHEAIRTLTEQKKICRVEGQVYFHAEAIKEAQRRITTHIQGDGNGRLESVDFKYLIDTTRKYAIPLLDYMDKIRFTRRLGNTRYLK